MPKAKYPPWWCHVISLVSCIYFIISPLLPVILLPLNLHFTLFGVHWIFMVATGVRTLPLSLTEWVKTRYLYIGACIKHRLYGPDPSTSGFLLLPPEIRLRIWEELIPRTRCVRGDTRITVSCKEIDKNINSDDGLWDCDIEYLRRSLGLPPRYRMRASPRIPVEFLRTCRRNYEEGNYFLYSTSAFEFEDHRALYYFVNTRSLSQQGNIRHLVLGWSSVYYWWLKFPALRAFEVPSIIEKLWNLRTLDIEHRVPKTECTRQLIPELVRHLRVSEAATVKLYLFGDHDSTWPDGTMQRERECHCQEEFAKAGWAIIRESEKPFPSLATHTGQYIRAKYVFEAVTSAQE